MSTPSEQSGPPVLHSLRMRLTYADCDPAGILYFATWFPWMERLQSEWFYLQNLRQDSLAERFGYSTVTRHTECEYLTQVGLFDTIDLFLRPGHIRNTSFTLHTTMWWREGSKVAARGEITLVCIDLDGQPTRVGEHIRSALANEQRSEGLSR